MDVIPIQVTAEGVIIPRVYLRDAEDVEVIVSDEFVVVRPRQRSEEASDKEAATPRSSGRYSFVGIGRSQNPRASEEAEAILERDVDRRNGFDPSP